jgi:putative transposase
VNDFQRMRELEDENNRLKKMFANVSLMNQALKDAIAKKL